MPNTREKLIELLDVASSIAQNICGSTACADCEGYGDGNGCTLYHMADHLIANGVTIQEWISVKDRLPNNIGLYLVIEKHWIDGSPCRRIAKWNTVDWFTADRKSKELTPRVTHWMPLPEPPKGE